MHLIIFSAKHLCELRNNKRKKKKQTVYTLNKSYIWYQVECYCNQRSQSLQGTIYFWSLSLVSFVIRRLSSSKKIEKNKKWSEIVEKGKVIYPPFSHFLTLYFFCVFHLKINLWNRNTKQGNSLMSNSNPRSIEYKHLWFILIAIIVEFILIFKM